MLFGLVLMLAGLAAHAQVAIDFSQFERYQNVRLKLQVQDKKSSEPIAYATVYLVPQGDTTVTNFALTDNNGSVEMKEIKPGKYQVNVEMIGYNPYQKEHDLKGWEKNLGVIELEENPEYIDAASITAIGNPITVKKDTIEYNANAFRVGENAMLSDLLRKIPGMEVGEDGTVKVNGETVDKITVGGKTFFFNDPKMAVSNLPAKIVNKIKVIDKDKPQAAFTGVSSGKEDKEKVMDLELKDEYKDGWFGNAKLSGGTTIPGKTDNPLQDKFRGVFNGNVLASGYNEHDQIVLLGGGQNAAEPGSPSAYIYSWGDEYDDDGFNAKRGLSTNFNAGANVSTDRIKTFSTSGSASYKHGYKDAREISSRTSFQSGEDNLLTSSNYNGTGSSDEIDLSFELERDSKEKVMFNFYPRLSFGRNDRNIEENAATTQAETEKNTSRSGKISDSKSLSTGASFWTGVKDLGKERRSLTAGGNFSFSTSAGNSHEIRLTTASGAVAEDRNLLYDLSSRSLGFGGDVAYTEPFGQNWSLQARVEFSGSSNNGGKDARNFLDGSANDYYSTISQSKNYNFNERLILQYKKDPLNVNAGVQAIQNKQDTRSKSLGNDITSTGAWQNNIAPYLNVRYNKGTFSTYVSAHSRSSTPSGNAILPVLDISNPLQLSTGNVYLKTSFNNAIYGGLSYNNPKTFSFLSLNMDASMNSNARVYASWFDDNGIRYAIPVNAKNPSWDVSAYLQWNRPIDKKKQLTLSLNLWGTYYTSTSYQALSRMPGFNTAAFDYDSMMASFWGDASGDRFYSGKSGFTESRTTSLNWSGYISLRWQLEKFALGGYYFLTNRFTKYSLDKTANTNTWDHSFRADAQYNTTNGWEFKTDIRYSLYRGYSYGFDHPECIWNVTVSKTIKSFTLRAGVADLLNQTRGLSRTASDEYVQDTFRNTLGRYFMVGLSFNFGKMNAKNNRRVQEAMWRTMF